MLPGVAAAEGCATNPVACENALPGAPPEASRVDGAGDPSLQGFATAMSVDRGETVSLKIDTTAPAYRVEIYRLGWYGGAVRASSKPCRPRPGRRSRRATSRATARG